MKIIVIIAAILIILISSSIVSAQVGDKTSGPIFGSCDCERMSILSQQLDDNTLKARALYWMDIIAWDYKTTPERFISRYCAKTTYKYVGINN